MQSFYQKISEQNYIYILKKSKLTGSEIKWKYDIHLLDHFYDMLMKNDNTSLMILHD